jgi:hypothetical protein
MTNKKLHTLSTILFFCILVCSCTKTGCQFAIKTNKLYIDDISHIEELLIERGFGYEYYYDKNGTKKTWHERTAPIGTDGEVYSLLSRKIGTTDKDDVQVYLYYVKLPLGKEANNIRVLVVNLYRCNENQEIRDEINYSGNLIYAFLVDLLGEEAVKKEIKTLGYPNV